ncbi:MAG: GNAT family protein [Hyphomicrobiaceae bacterium]
MTSIETPRLLLRRLVPGDARAIARHLGNWDVARMLALPPWPYRLADAQDFVGRMERRPQEDPALTLAITPRPPTGDAGEVIGVVDLAAAGSRPILGYWLGQPWWGQGLMTEAVATLVAYAFATRSLETIYSGVFHDNPASLAVQRKLGFVVTGESVVRCAPRNLDVRHIDTALTRAAFVAATAGTPTP